MRLLIALTVITGIAFLSANGDNICNTYEIFDDRCSSNDCSGPIISILHFNSQMQDYEFPSQMHVGQTYLLNAYVPNNNYCKKTTTISQEYQNYKSEPYNYTSPKYDDLKFSYVVQISKVDNGTTQTAYLNVFNGVAKPGEKTAHTFLWSPQQVGSYKIERFIIYDLSRPIPLAPSYTKYVQVSGEQQTSSRFMSPIEQFIYGMSLNSNKKEMVIAIKASTGMSVVVTPHTKEILVERGWARP